MVTIYVNEHIRDGLKKHAAVLKMSITDLVEPDLVELLARLDKLDRKFSKKTKPAKQ